VCAVFLSSGHVAEGTETAVIVIRFLLLVNIYRIDDTRAAPDAAAVGSSGDLSDSTWASCAEK
jgi:hypothetical protein